MLHTTERLSETAVWRLSAGNIARTSGENSTAEHRQPRTLRRHPTARPSPQRHHPPLLILPPACPILENRRSKRHKTCSGCPIHQKRITGTPKQTHGCPILQNRTSNAAKVRCGCPFLQNRTTGVLKVCCGCPFLQNQTSEARFVSDSWAYLTYMADLLMRHEPFRLYMAVSLRKYAQNVPPKWCFAVS